MIEKVASFNVGNIITNCESFEKVLPRFSNEFLHCDPPYYLGNNSTLFCGLYTQRNFLKHHNSFDHERLRNLFLNFHKCGFIFSYIYCTTIRERYADCQIIEAPWQYTMGQEELRIVHNRIKENRNHIK